MLEQAQLQPVPTVASPQTTSESPLLKSSSSSKVHRRLFLRISSRRVWNAHSCPNQPRAWSKSETWKQTKSSKSPKKFNSTIWKSSVSKTCRSACTSAKSRTNSDRRALESRFLETVSAEKTECLVLLQFGFILRRVRPCKVGEIDEI